LATAILIIYEKSKQSEQPNFQQSAADGRQKTAAAAPHYRWTKTNKTCFKPFSRLASQYFNLDTSCICG